MISSANIIIWHHTKTFKFTDAWSTAQNTHSLSCKATLRAHSHWEKTNAKGTLFFGVCWLCHFRIRCRLMWNIPYLGLKSIFCFTRNWKNSIIIKSLHYYKLHVTSLFTRILLDLSCVSRRSSFQRIARGAFYNRMSTNLPQNLSKKVMLLHWKHDEFFKDVPKYEAFHFKPSSWIQLR